MDTVRPHRPRTSRRICDASSMRSGGLGPLQQSSRRLPGRKQDAHPSLLAASSRRHTRRAILLDLHPVATTAGASPPIASPRAGRAKGLAGEQPSKHQPTELTQRRFSGPARSRRRLDEDRSSTHLADFLGGSSQLSCTELPVSHCFAECSVSLADTSAECILQQCLSTQNWSDVNPVGFEKWSD